jgi:hypothetical protein
MNSQVNENLTTSEPIEKSSEVPAQEEIEVTVEETTPESNFNKIMNLI